MQKSPTQRNVADWLLSAGALLVATTGVAVILGWYLHLSWVVQLHSSLVAMQYNTALGFLFLGASMLALVWKRPYIASCAAVVPFVVGVLTLIEYGFAVSLGIDELFMTHDILEGASHPGRMAPNSALSFVVGAIGIFCGVFTRLTQRMGLAAIAGSVVFALGMVAFVGYLSTVPTAYGWGQLTKMALHTSLAFIVFSSMLLTWSWIHDRNAPPDWLPAMSGIIAATVTVLVWQSLVAAIANQNIATTGSFATWLTLVLGLVAATLLAVCVHSIMSLRRANSTLEERQLRLQQINEHLEEFAYIAAHDIRTPLSGIERLSGWIKEDAGELLPAVSREHLEKLEQRIERLTSLLDDLNRFTQAGRTGERLVLLNIADVVNEAVARAAPEGASVVLSGAFPDIETLKTPLVDCLYELIDNALKHNNSNDPSIEISCESNAYWIDLTVADDGPGIAAEHQERIFGLFQTLTPAGSTKNGGMGLALVKRIAQAVGGTIRVASNGQGSAFHLRWPLVIQPEVATMRAPQIAASF